MRAIPTTTADTISLSLISIFPAMVRPTPALIAVRVGYQFGTQTNKFQGHFDGKHKSIIGLYINDEDLESAGTTG